MYESSFMYLLEVGIQIFMVRLNYFALCHRIYYYIFSSQKPPRSVLWQNKRCNFSFLVLLAMNFKQSP